LKKSDFTQKNTPVFYAGVFLYNKLEAERLLIVLGGVNGEHAGIFSRKISFS